MSDKYIIKNCPCYNNERFIGGFLDDKATFCTYYGKKCQNCSDCVMKQIVELCKEPKIINCNIDGKEQVLKAYYHTHLGDKILELLDIEEVE